MKKTIGIISILLCIGFFRTAVVAQSTSPSIVQTATPTTKNNQIDDLKDRLATKVAELRQTQKKAIAGSVKAVSISTATIATLTGEVKIELIDTLKVIQILKGVRTELTTDDLSVNDNVVVFGDYDATIELLKAKVIFIQAAPQKRISGTVTDIDREGYTVTIKTPQDATYIIDIEKSTSMLQYLSDKGIVKGGFSKLETGTTAHIVGTDVPKKENRISAKRFLDVGFVFGTPTPTPETSPTATLSATPAE